MRDAAKAWPSDGKIHKHYINAPVWVVSPVVKLGVVESFTTPAGPRYISHECVWMALSLRDSAFHFPPSSFSFFQDYFLLHFLYASMRAS
jgi:hypothetical protein